MSEDKFVEYDQQTKKFIFNGEWNLSNIKKIQKEFLKKIKTITANVTISGENIKTMDSAGAWLIADGVNILNNKHIKVHLENFSKQYQKLMSLNKKNVSYANIPKEDELNFIQQLGKYSIEQMTELYEFINFVGELFFESIRIFYTPSLWRWNTIASTINKTGTQALPIIALLSFMVGVVISYQMGNQLKKYGADVFIVDLLGLSVLREFGPLITAIMVAGRTGSSFTALLGTMKINQEIDALNIMGITPVDLLLLPRLIGLVIVLPLLTAWADVFGVLGGMIMAQSMLDVTWVEFFRRFQQEIPIRSLMIGLCKAPIFALIVAGVGCFQGIKVHGSSEIVGERTTRSVVLAIFFIVIIDGLLSILLSKFKL